MVQYYQEIFLSHICKLENKIQISIQVKTIGIVTFQTFKIIKYKIH